MKKLKGLLLGITAVCCAVGFAACGGGSGSKSYSDSYVKANDYTEYKDPEMNAMGYVLLHKEKTVEEMGETFDPILEVDYAYDLNQEISAKDGYFIEWYDDPLLLDENKEQTEEVHIGENDFYCAINDKKGNCIAVYKMTLHVVCEDEYHTWLDWRTEDDACIVGGDKERTCFHCGKKEIEKIKARGYHNYVDGKCDKCEKEVTPT